MEKNRAGQSILAFAFTVATNLPRDGDAANLSALIRKDGGSFVALSSVAPPTALGGGLYEFPLSVAETNADVIDFKMSSTTSGVLVIPQPSARIYTESMDLGTSGGAGGSSGSDEFTFGPVESSWNAKVFAKGGSTLLYTRAATAVGTSKIRWTIDTSAIPDGSYDVEHEFGYGLWAMVVVGGVAVVYDNWSDRVQSEGSGQYAITLTALESAGSTPLQGVLVTVQRNGGNVYWKHTDSLGKAVFLLDPATYSINASLPGYGSIIGQQAVVSGNGSGTLLMGAVSIVPPTPVSSSGGAITEDLMTFADLVHRLCARRGLDGSNREIVQLRVAVGDAYRELPNRHTWKHYERQVIFKTSPQKTLSVTYDHTGGSLERLLTLTSGTFPSDVAMGEFNYSNETFKIERLVSPNTAVVSASRNPGADFTGDVVWHRSSYSLPYQIRQISEIVREKTGLALVNISSTEMSSFERRLRTPGTPSRYMVRSSENVFGATDIEIYPPPAEEINYSVSMSIRPDMLSIFEVTGTDGAGTASSTTFTSGSASFTTQMLGSVLRLSPSGLTPKGRTQYDDQLPEFIFQTRVKAILGATQLELEDALPSSFTGRGYTISDPVDINTSVMLPYLEAISWEKFCHNHDVKTMDLAKKVSLDELRTAMQAENAVNWNTEGSRFQGWAGNFRLKDFAVYVQ